MRRRYVITLEFPDAIKGGVNLALAWVMTKAPLFGAFITWREEPRD